MSDAHESMVTALQNEVIPTLRQRGFKGSFPHFRRPGEGRIDLLTFQFDQHGGGFVIEIAQCPPDGIVTSWGDIVPAEKVSAHDLHPERRLRLNPGEDGSPASWFRYDEGGGDQEKFAEVAKSVVPYLDEAEKWWEEISPE